MSELMIKIAAYEWLLMVFSNDWMDGWWEDHPGVIDGDMLRVIGAGNDVVAELREKLAELRRQVGE